MAMAMAIAIAIAIAMAIMKTIPSMYTEVAQIQAHRHSCYNSKILNTYPLLGVMRYHVEILREKMELLHHRRTPHQRNPIC